MNKFISLIILFSNSIENHISFLKAMVNSFLTTGFPIIFIYFFILSKKTKKDNRYKSGYRIDMNNERIIRMKGLKYGIIAYIIIGIPLGIIYYLFNIDFNVFNLF